jgi:hypothetical protein
VSHELLDNGWLLPVSKDWWVLNDGGHFLLKADAVRPRLALPAGDAPHKLKWSFEEQGIRPVPVEYDPAKLNAVRGALGQKVPDDVWERTPFLCLDSPYHCVIYRHDNQLTALSEKYVNVFPDHGQWRGTAPLKAFFVMDEELVGLLMPVRVAWLSDWAISRTLVGTL